MEEREKEIQQEMLEAIDNSYEKVPGSFIYDVTRPPAEQFAKMEKRNQEVKDKLSIENLSGDELAQEIYERTGINRREATNAIGLLQVEGDGKAFIGNRFETDSGVEFEAIETNLISGVGNVEIQAIEPGEIGNVPANQITQIPVTLEGIVSVTNPEPTYDGFAQESDADLLERYYERIRTPATSGNIYHYLNWSKEVPGVGDAKIFPLWIGDNTVKVVIINADRQPASDDLVEDVQEYIDPGATGLGDGEAPIGAYCTVVSAIGLVLAIVFTPTIAEGFIEQDATDEVSAQIKTYLQSIAFNQDFVSYAQVGAIILNCESIVDYTNLTINGDISNISIQAEQVAILGGVTIV